MIEVSYMEFLRNTTKYTFAVIDRGEQVVVNRDGRKFYLLDYQTISLIKTALDVASSSIDPLPESYSVIDNA